MQCDVCACAFEPVSSAWLDRCGTCIAAEIELALMCPHLGQGDRKPLCRAALLADTEIAKNDPMKAA